MKTIIFAKHDFKPEAWNDFLDQLLAYGLINQTQREHNIQYVDLTIFQTGIEFD